MDEFTSEDPEVSDSDPLAFLDSLFPAAAPAAAPPCKIAALATAAAGDATSNSAKRPRTDEGPREQ